jgi:hypothetical protein
MGVSEDYNWGLESHEDYEARGNTTYLHSDEIVKAVFDTVDVFYGSLGRRVE